MEIICIFSLCDLKCHSCLPDGPQHACARAPGQQESMPSEMLGRSDGKWCWHQCLLIWISVFISFHLEIKMRSPLLICVLCVAVTPRRRLYTETVSPTAGLARPCTRNLYSSPSYSAAVKFNSIAHHMTDLIFFYRFEWVFKGWIGPVPHKKNQRAEIIYKCQWQSVGLPKQPLIPTGQPIILSL